MKSFLYTPEGIRLVESRTGWTGLTIGNEIGGEPVLERSDEAHLPFESIDPPDDAINFAIELAMEGYSARYIGIHSNEPFVWYSHSGDAYDAADMATQHLFYSLRMVWNHSVPEIWRVGDYKRYRDVPKWSQSYRTRAITELTKELVSRDDSLSDDLRQQFHEMVLKTITILALGI